MLDPIVDEQERLVLDELQNDAVQAALASGVVALAIAAIPASLLTLSTAPFASFMGAVYLKAVADNISEGFGSEVERSAADAASSGYLSLVDNFNSTTQREISSAMVTAATLQNEDGSAASVALKSSLAVSLVKSIFNKLRGQRKKLIVDTAVLGPYNQGLYDSAVAESKKSNVDIRKTWMSLMDERVRSAHRSLHGTELPVEAPFIVNGIALRFPKDPLAPPGLTINCRCVLRFRKITS